MATDTDESNPEAGQVQREVMPSPCECGNKTPVLTSRNMSFAQGDAAIHYWVECQDCGRRGKPFHEYSLWSWRIPDETAKILAIDAWNAGEGWA